MLPTWGAARNAGAVHSDVSYPLEHLQVYAATSAARINSVRADLLRFSALKTDKLDLAVGLALNSCISGHVVVHEYILSH